MIDLPNYIDPEVWKAFLEMRKKIRRPMTEYAEKLAIKRLLALWDEYGDHPNTVLEQSILNSWMGLWHLKSEGGDDRMRRELNVGKGPEVRRN